VSFAEVLREDLAAAAGDPVDAGVAQARSRVGERKAGPVGEEDELGDRERVELDVSPYFSRTAWNRSQ